MSYMERHQVALYLASMAVGGASAGLSGWSLVSEQLVPYALGALLWTNFALMPLVGMSVGQHKRLARTVVLVATLGTPILVAPLVSLFIPEGGPIALATVIVLLAPCVDYVVVFACIAGGEYRGLLATTPYLLGTQIVSIPFWTSAYAYIGILDIGVVGEIFPLPTESYLSLAPLIVPLIAAYLVQPSALSPATPSSSTPSSRSAHNAWHTTGTPKRASWAPPYSPKPSPSCSSWSP